MSEQAQQITDLLKNNPDIFEQNPQLLELITLSDDRSTASLLERQIIALRNRIKEHKKQYHALVSIAQENEQISNTFNQIIYQLISFTSSEQFQQELPKALQANFDVDEISIVLKADTQDTTTYQQTLERLSQQKTLCDNKLPSSIISFLFTTPIKSAAIIPLFSGQPKQASAEIIGLLALGSLDHDRYTLALGTTHLDRLGVMAGICLNRLLADSE